MNCLPSDPPCPPAWGLRGLGRPPSTAWGFVRREAAAFTALTADRVGPASDLLSLRVGQVWGWSPLGKPAHPAPPLAGLGDRPPISRLFSESCSNPHVPPRQADLPPASPPGPPGRPLLLALLPQNAGVGFGHTPNTHGS